MLVGGAGIYSYFDKLPVLGALFAAVSTVTTLGFYSPNNRNFFTMNSSESVLLIIMIVISVGTVASILQTSVKR